MKKTVHAWQEIKTGGKPKVIKFYLSEAKPSKHKFGICPSMRENLFKLERHQAYSNANNEHDGKTQKTTSLHSIGWFPVH